jgi:hypothetical protein
LGSDFKRKAGLNYIEDSELEPFSKADCTSMHLGGITHADAIVKCNEIDPELEQRLSSYGKPVLDHTDEKLADKYLDFYNSLLSSH